MSSGMKTVIYPVKDLERSKNLFSRFLGTEPVIDEPYYAAFQAGRLQVGLDPTGHAQGMTAPVGHFHVSDIRSSLQKLLDAGAEMVLEVRDVGKGKLIASVNDADSNVIGLIQES